MKVLAKAKLVALVLSLVLSGCENDKPKKSRRVCNYPSYATEIVNDDVLRNSAVDFIANAGDRVYFAYDSYNLSKESKRILDQQADWLKTHPERRVLIEGHCDDRGTREYNLGLGERRADAVARYLVDQGVPGENIRSISYGKDRPIVAEGSPEHILELNRVCISVIE